MDTAAIEREAKRLRRTVYDRRREFWPNGDPHPFEMLDPQIAAAALGLIYETPPDLKLLLIGRQFEAAGALDREGRILAVATRFGDEVARFTGSHELGHYVLHGYRSHFRDAPIKGLERVVKDPMEREADHFAAMFLMPAHFVRKIFHLMFQTSDATPFHFNEATIAALGRTGDQATLLYPDSDSLVRERALASTRRFGKFFEKSLAGMFHVSVETMAIRIRELGLVRAWP